MSVSKFYWMMAAGVAVLGLLFFVLWRKFTEWDWAEGILDVVFYSLVVCIATIPVLVWFAVFTRVREIKPTPE